MIENVDGHSLLCADAQYEGRATTGGANPSNNRMTQAARPIQTFPASTYDHTCKAEENEGKSCSRQPDSVQPHRHRRPHHHDP
ncbi:hypothetical protein SISSUDRAFT_1046355, partial [Sistotremastrum suecicum HHB10207 ss-3]